MSHGDSKGTAKGETWTNPRSKPTQFHPVFSFIPWRLPIFSAICWDGIPMHFGSAWDDITTTSWNMELLSVTLVAQHLCFPLLSICSFYSRGFRISLRTGSHMFPRHTLCKSPTLFCGSLHPCATSSLANREGFWIWLEDSRNHFFAPAEELRAKYKMVTPRKFPVRALQQQRWFSQGNGFAHLAAGNTRLKI